MATSCAASPMSVRQKHAVQLQKTVMCKFFAAGKCNKGVACQYAHGVSDLRSKPDLSCTSLCPEFARTGTCNNPDCRYAHDSEELRTTNTFFKSKMCMFAQRGRCKYGEACRFAHTDRVERSTEALQSAAALEAKVKKTQGGTGGKKTQGGTGGTGGTQGGWPETDSTTGSGTGSSQHGSSGSHGSSVPNQFPRNGQSPSCGSSSGHSMQPDSLAPMSTPEGTSDGSGDSDGDVRRYVQAHNGDTGATDRTDKLQQGLTTVMVRNVPPFLTQGSLVSLLEDLSPCMCGTFDFFYCPWDPVKDCNLGYAIINFFSGSCAATFEREWSKKYLLAGCRGSKRLKIVPAPFQGLLPNIQHFSAFSLVGQANPRFRPLVRVNASEPLRPMAPQVPPVEQSPLSAMADQLFASNFQRMNVSSNMSGNTGPRRPGSSSNQAPASSQAFTWMSSKAMLPTMPAGSGYNPIQQQGTGSGQALCADEETLRLLAQMQANCTRAGVDPQAFMSSAPVQQVPFLLSGGNVYECASRPTTYTTVDGLGHYAD